MNDLSLFEMKLSTREVLCSVHEGTLFFCYLVTLKVVFYGVMYE